MRSLQVTAYNTSSSSLAVSWNVPEDLTHGIFCGVQILYRLNDSSEKFIVSFESGTQGYELINLKPYTLYAVSVRPVTLEGEGKETEVVVRTAEDGEH